MKKHLQILSMLAVLLCFAGCSDGSTGASSVFGETVPGQITKVELSGFYNGSDLEPRELSQEETEGLERWLSELSLKHRTYAEGEAPNEVWSGGTAYQFQINGGELSFTWSYIDRAYIVYDGEWYEITGGSAPPLGSDIAKGAGRA